MAYYQNLPIYRKTFELILYIETIVRNFPRYHKYAIGAEMRSLSKNIAVLIIVTTQDIKTIFSHEGTKRTKKYKSSILV